MSDFISRKALKEILVIKFGNQLPNGLLDEIDNAPTVELFCSYLSDGEVKQPCVEGPCEDERPQGEWIFNTSFWSCSVCKNSAKTIGYCGDKKFMNEFFKFCPNCGADMRGGEDNGKTT